MSHVVDVRSGKFHCGADCQIGQNVVVEVDEEVVLGDRCVVGDNTYFGGRRVEIDDDFYGYSWEWRRLDIGRGRRGEADAILKVGKRSTFHDNKVDLARRVTVGDDVGLSPEVAVYTHHYWGSPFDGYGYGYHPVWVGNMVVVGFRSTLMPRTVLRDGCTVAAGAVVIDQFDERTKVGGVPAKVIGKVMPQDPRLFDGILRGILDQYRDRENVFVKFPFVRYRDMLADVVKLEVGGGEDEHTDDLRDFLFKRGIRLYTKRRFRRLQR